MRFNSDKRLKNGSYQLTRRAKIELSFTRLAHEPIDLTLDKAIFEKADTEWTNLNSKVRRLPMTIERLPG